ncbi:protein IQ-DOMAIN 1 [Punica granatum]|uniref:Protein IQ-DOMAIN 1 n=1 Tax=Punica granatum TaxID=22663 RepID=A0A218X4X3_PUNGR|nr:protein IQ-DOMAIN 1 [Punica granatum]OWM79779.1 hypothetical protein CDL15_Pgr023191 [Punica granatum]
MGLKGELVKSVFSRSRSGAQDRGNGRKSSVEKRRWSSVRSYLCGEELEFDSVIAEEDSASVKSSEATVTQPVTGDVNAGEGLEDAGITKEEILPQPQQQQQNSMSKLYNKEDAAVVIQTAFRRYLARRLDEAKKSTSGHRDDELPVEMGSPRKAESISTSIEVQTGNSIEVLSVRDEKLLVIGNRMQHKARTTQVMKSKEDWDHSTVNSNISRMRVQHRLEALTRRERALAYAFSQQLRVCSKKRQTKTSDGTEPDMGWSWLERWMATRESSIAAGPGNQRFIVGKRLLDLAGEEKESCGSNEVSVHFDSVSLTAAEDRDCSKPGINGNKSTKNMTNHKTSPGRQSRKVSKKDSRKNMGTGIDKKHKQKLTEGKNENECKDA